MDWKQEKDVEALVYPENFGPRMSIDELSLHNGELYTAITNKDAKGRKGCLAALIKGTKNEVVSRGLSAVPVRQLMAVKEITADLANSMDWICRTNFMNATLTADRFHVQGLVHDAVQEIRVAERRKAIDEDNEAQQQAGQDGIVHQPYRFENGDTKKQLLARSRYLLFKPMVRWTYSQCQRAAILFREFSNIKLAYDLSMQFRDIFEQALTESTAGALIQDWIQLVKTSKLEPLISTSQTIHNNYSKIIAFFKNRETNAGAESFNAKLKGFRAILRGIRDVSFFLYRVEKLYA